MTEYIAITTRFAGAGVIGEMEAFTHRGGQGRPMDSATAKSPRFNVSRRTWRSPSKVSLARMTRTLMKTDLGRDAGQRVLTERTKCPAVRSKRRHRQPTTPPPSPIPHPHTHPPPPPPPPKKTPHPRHPPFPMSATLSVATCRWGDTLTPVLHRPVEPTSESGHSSMVGTPTPVAHRVARLFSHRR